MFSEWHKQQISWILFTGQHCDTKMGCIPLLMFSKLNRMLLGYFDLEKIFKIIKPDICRDAWTNITAKKEPMVHIRHTGNCRNSTYVLPSVAVLAEIPLKSPQKLFIFIIKKNICWLKVSKNKIINILKKTSLVLPVVGDISNLSRSWVQPYTSAMAQAPGSFAYVRSRISPQHTDTAGPVISDLHWYWIATIWISISQFADPISSTNTKDERCYLSKL